MKLHNRMEHAVLVIIDRILSDRQDICTCQKCRLDIAAITLNNLPPKYVVTSKGDLYSKINEMETQFEVNIIREVTKAIEKVSRDPQHNIE